MSKEVKLWVLALIINALFSLPQSASAGNRTWLGSVNSAWNSPTNWSGATVPGSGDNITIPSGLSHYPVVATAGAVCSQITFSGTSTPAPSLTINNGGSLTAGGNLTMIAGASVVIHPGGTFTLNGNCNNTGIGLLNMDGGTFVFNGNNLFIPSNLTGGTVDIIHSNPHVGITNFYNLTYSGGSHAFTLAGNTTVNGNLDIATGSQLAVNGYNVTANTLTLGSTTVTAGAYNNGNASAYIQGTTTHVTVSAGAATRLAFITQPTDTIMGQVISNVVVRIQDASGNNVSTVNVPITLSLNTAGFARGITLTNSDINGAATFNGLIINIARSYAMGASAPGLASATSSPFAINAPASAGSGTQVAGAPPLSISTSGSAVTVSWLHTTGWILQQNNNPAASTGWSACNGVFTANGLDSLTINAPTGSMFFRLYQ